MDNSHRRQCLADYARKENLNPIILCMFVEEGDKANIQMVRVITQRMQAEFSGSDWKSKIIFSRRWLPLMKVRMVDSYNYFKLFAPSFFPKIIADLIEY